MLVRIVKDWHWPDLLRQTPKGSGWWRDLQFTQDPVERCDYLVVLNNRRNEKVTVQCPEQNFWCVMQEPYIPLLHDWMIKDLDWCSRIFSHVGVAAPEKFEQSHPALPWHINRSYDQLLAMKPPCKSRLVSWVTSRLTFLPMHRKRMAFFKHLQSERYPVDVYGKGIRYIADKWDGLAPYHYSIVIENDRHNDYWSEKLADCFLSWTVPVYDGCLNLGNYFPTDAFIRIDADNPVASLHILTETANPQDWRRRLEAVEEARNLVLQRWQFFPYFYEKIVNDKQAAGALTSITIPDNQSMRAADRRRFLAQQLAAHGPMALVRLLQDKINYLRWSRYQ
jgi:hypothetical protein